MNITFLVPCKDLAGGLRVVAAYGNALLRRGHNVTVVYPRRRLPARETLRRQVKRWVYREWDHLDRFQGKLLKVRSIGERHMPDADCLIATAWETAEWAKDFSRRCGKKFYLIQHYETWSGDQTRVDATFRYPFQKIVISNWLKQVMTEKTGETDIPVIPNGRDFFLSEALGDGIHRPYDIGMLYSPVAFKRTGDGIEAIRRVMQTFPRIRTVFFGSEWPREELFKNAKFFRRPTQDHIRKIYLSTRIWISASLTEGFCLPALEAISLGCAVVATDSLGIRDIIQSGENGVLVEPGKPEHLAREIVRVLNDPALERKLRIAGLKRSEAFSWETATDLLEGVLGSG
jgi:glycosyltransferase involved in cell wall biosynthesis